MPAFQLGQRRPVAARRERVRRGDAERGQLVFRVLVVPLVLAGLVLATRGRERRHGVREDPRGRVEVGQRHVRHLLLAGADGAEYRDQRLPVLLAAQAPDQPHEVAAAENRQLGIERAPSGRHRMP